MSGISQVPIRARYQSRTPPPLPFRPSEARSFVEAIVNGTRPKTDGWNGLRVVEVIEAAQTSLRDNGGHVAVRPGTLAARQADDTVVMSEVESMAVALGGN